MDKQVIISNPEDFEEKKKAIIEEGASNFHVLADFDRTLTKAFDEDGNKVTSVISILRDWDYLSEEYSKAAKELFEKYHAIEIDPNLSLEAKIKHMQEWWETHYDLLIKSGLKKEHLQRVIDSDKIILREGVEEFLDILKEKNIPLVIISSSGLGHIIDMFLEKIGKMHNNIYVITNELEFDNKGNLVGVKLPLIHSLNKSEASICNEELLKKLSGKKNISLLGDGIGDLGMIQGFEYDNLIKIGFLNYNIEENLERYKENFDVVITGDGDFSFINDLIEGIK